MALTALNSTNALFLPLVRNLSFPKSELKSVLVWPVLIVAMIAIGWASLFLKLQAERQLYQERALADAGEIARSYVENLSRSVDLIDQITRHVRYQWESTDGQLRLEELKQRGLFPSESLMYVVIVDRDGYPVSSTVRPIQKTNFSSSPFFQAQKNAADDFLFLGTPVVGPLTGRNVIQFSRRIVGQNGAFAGAVLVSVSPEYFIAGYDNTILGNNGLLAILNQDGAVLASRTGNVIHTYESPALSKVPHFPASQNTAEINGTTWFADQRDRYIARAAVEAYPLTVVAGLDKQDYLTHFFHSREDAIREATIATSILVAFKLLALLFAIRLAQRKAEVDLLQRSYRMASEGSHDGFYIAHPIADRAGAITDFELVDCNYSGAMLFNQRQEGLLGKRLSLLFDGESFIGVLDVLKKTMAHGHDERDLEVQGAGFAAPRRIHMRSTKSNGHLALTLRYMDHAKVNVGTLAGEGAHDELTGLPNRQWVIRYLSVAVKRAAEHDLALAVLYIDLDRFKLFNDVLGHMAGDELLRKAAERLRLSVRPQDHLARLGADRFLVILEPIMHRGHVAEVAQRIAEAFQEKFQLHEGTHTISASIGISTFPYDAKDANTLLQNADVAMYAAKLHGRGNYRFYEPTLHDQLRHRLNGEKEFREAIERDEFFVLYQPRIDATTGAISSMEALVRWQHPQKGMLEPVNFIPLAEETGLIREMGELVIEKVCAQVAIWTKGRHMMVPVSINVSPTQVESHDFAEIFLNYLSCYGVDPQLIEIEITESSAMTDNPWVSKALTSIQQSGSKLLVDDFGTGYSSLAQLQRLDFDVLKVDRAFTLNIENSDEGKVFYTAIITMAHALGMRVVAEGVETEGQLKILQNLHCDEIQGFYFSKPLSARNVSSLLQKH